MKDRARALASLREACRDGSVDLLSLDVFDTVLVRRVARPVDAFAILGARLADEDALPIDWGPPAFARLRRLAEEQARTGARQAGRSHEIALRDVYAELPSAVTAGPGIDWFVDEEVRLERELCFVDPAIVEVVALARASDVAIALVSDTYFSAAHLDFLVGDRLGDAERWIFTSSDHGLGKGDGLFDVVLDQVDVEAHRALHVGDNPHADVVSPARIGIRTVHLTRVPPALDELMESEGTACDTGREVIHPPVFDWARGDHGLAALRVRAGTRALGAGDDALDPYREVGATVLGPVLVGFADWVVHEAAAVGAARVYCFMREGALLAPLVDRMAESRGVTLEARPLWLSRQVAARAAITAVDEATIRSFLARRRTPTARELAAALGVSVDHVATRGTADVPLDDVLLANRVVARIVEDARVQRRILDGANRARARLARYLETVLDPADAELVVVDLGWNGTIQTGLERALAAMGDPRPTRGRYLATTAHSGAAALAGLRTKGFLVELGAPDGDAVALVRNPEILEMVTLPAEGSVRDYSAAGEPVLDDRPVGLDQLAQEAAVREGIAAFETVYRECRLLHPSLALTSSAPALRAILRRFVARPTDREFALFSRWAHEDNFGSSTTATLGAVDDAVDLRYVAPSQLYRLPQRWWFWPAGVAAAAAPELARAADRVLDGSVPAEVGERAPAGWHAVLEVESPVAVGDPAASTAPIVLNEHGRALVHMVSVVAQPRTVRCRLSVDDTSRVCIDRVRAVFGVRNAPDTVLDAPGLGEWWAIALGSAYPDGRESTVVTARDGEIVIELNPRHLPRGETSRTELVLYLEVAQACWGPR